MSSQLLSSLHTSHHDLSTLLSQLTANETLRYHTLLSQTNLIHDTQDATLIALNNASLALHAEIRASAVLQQLIVE